MTAYVPADWGGFATTAATAAATLTGLLFVAVSIDLRAGRSEYEPAWSRPVTRVLPMTVGCACVVVAGVSLVHQAGGGLYWLVPATVTAILAGLVNTWMLLVEIMR